MSEAGRAWTRFGVPVVALGVLFGIARATTPAERSVARVSVESPSAPAPGEYPDDDVLARSVRYSDTIHVDQAARLRVRLSGRGSVHVALIAEGDGPAYVREAIGDAPGEVQFAALEPGDWVMRLRALPGGQDLVANAHLGGLSWGLFALAAGLLLLPLAWPYRRAPAETWRRFTAARR